MGTTKSYSLIYLFQKKKKECVLYLGLRPEDSQKNKTQGHLSQAAPCLRHILLPSWTLISAPFPELLLWNRENRAIHQLLPRQSSDSWIMSICDSLFRPLTVRACDIPEMGLQGAVRRPPR